MNFQRISFAVALTLMLPMISFAESGDPYRYSLTSSMGTMLSKWLSTQATWQFTKAL